MTINPNQRIPVLIQHIRRLKATTSKTITPTILWQIPLPGSTQSMEEYLGVTSPRVAMATTISLEHTQIHKLGRLWRSGNSRKHTERWIRGIAKDYTMTK
jgi:hypothetical protein